MTPSSAPGLRVSSVLPVAMFFGTFSWSFVYTLAAIGVACLPVVGPRAADVAR